MIHRLTVTVAGVLLALAGQTQADIIHLNGFGASSGVPLSASISIQIVSPSTLTMTLTNDASLGGADNRITYFGFQMPVADFAVTVDSASDSRWTIENNAKVPGRGANTFNWLLQENERGGAAGLNVGESLVLNVNANSGAFNTFDTSTWTPTSKNGYLFATKFQSVGPNSEDSGVAFATTPPTPTSPPSVNTSIPEPATIVLAGLGISMILGTRRTARRR